MDNTEQNQGIPVEKMFDIVGRQTVELQLLRERIMYLEKQIEEAKKDKI